MRSQTRLYFWLQVFGLSNARREWSPSSAALHPVLRRRSCASCRVFLRVGGVAPHPAQIAVAGQAEDRLDREVGVVGQVAHEIVGAKLVFRVEAVLFQVLGPLRQLAATTGSTKFALPSSWAMASHRISMLPLSSTGMPSPPSSRAAGDGIGAQVVRRIGKFPVPARRRKSGWEPAWPWPAWG